MVRYTRLDRKLGEPYITGYSCKKSISDSHQPFTTAQILHL